MQPTATVKLSAVERHPLVARLINSHESSGPCLLNCRDLGVLLSGGRAEDNALEERAVARPIRSVALRPGAREGIATPVDPSSRALADFALVHHLCSVFLRLGGLTRRRHVEYVTDRWRNKIMVMVQQSVHVG